MDATTKLFDYGAGVRPYVAAAAILLLASAIVKRLLLDLPKVPRFGRGHLEAWMTWSPSARMDLHTATAEGYDKVIQPHSKPFIVPQCGMDTWVLPEKYLSFLKSETRDELSLAESFNNLMNMVAAVGEESSHDLVEIEVIGKFMNPKLPQMAPIMVDQLEWALKEIGDCSDWKEFNIFHTNSNIVTSLVNRLLVGEKLSRNPEYAKCIKSYIFSFLLLGFAWPIRPPQFVARWVYWIAAIPHRRDINRAMKFLLPVIEERMAGLPTQDSSNKPLDMVQWLLEMPVPRPEEGSTLRHAERLLHLTFASAAVPETLLTHMIHELLEHPEYLKSLRDEIDECLEEYGGWNDKTLSKMEHVDSYVRETARLYPPSVLTGHRTVMNQNFDFGDGLVLPPNTRVCFPTTPIHRNPKNYEAPTEFRPFRFVETKDGAVVESTLKAWRMDPTYLTFGFGRQACPGRFFAVRSVKMSFAMLIHRYDMKWAGKHRPTYGTMEGMIFASQNTRVALRNRQTGSKH